MSIPATHPAPPERSLPLDHPTAERPHRVYVALTNHCNRSCPWCSTYSSPSGNTWLTPETFTASLPGEGPFEVQLEGGEPTTHPRFAELVHVARQHPRCVRLVICTNGVLLPRQRQRLEPWIQELGDLLTLKLSINHHLLERDPGLLDLAAMVREVFEELGGDRLLVLNVRLRKGVENDDAAVIQAVKETGLMTHANVFFLQRYGLASVENAWETPFLVGTNFRLVNPDGRIFGPDLIARSEAMGRLA